MMKVEPTKEHAWLRRLVGEWTYESECPAGPDQPAMKVTGTDSVRALGEVWIVAEGRGEMPGGGVGHMRMQVGYDPQKGKFVGTWIGSMMTNLWVYEGWLDDAEKVLTLESQGPSFTDPGKTDTYRDIIEVLGPDARTLTSKMRDEKGEWQTFMVARYTRVG